MSTNGVTEFKTFAMRDIAGKRDISDASGKTKMQIVSLSDGTVYKRNFLARATTVMKHGRLQEVSPWAAQALGTPKFVA